MNHFIRSAIVPQALIIVMVAMPPQPGASQIARDENDKSLAAAALAWASFESQAGVLTMYDRQGQVVQSEGQRAVYNWPRFSPDGKRLAVSRRDDTMQNAEISVFDLPNGGQARITADAATAHSTPVWSPDGLQIAYAANSAGAFGVYRKTVDGTGSAELLYQHPTNPAVTDWSADGRFLVFHDATRLFLLPLTGPRARQATEVLPREFLARAGTFSPDSHFLAYVSASNGIRDVWVRPIDPASATGLVRTPQPWRISTEGGVGLVFWRDDGRELYYLAADQSVMSVEISTSPVFTHGPPKALFKAPAGAGAAAVSSDGQQFLFTVLPNRRGAPFPRQLTVFDRQGTVARALESPAAYTQPMLSPDGTRVSAFLNGDLYAFDLRTDTRVRVTASAVFASYQESSVWSPDGRHIAFFSFRDNWGGLYQKASDGTGTEQLLYRHALGVDIPLTDWSSDRRRLAFSAGGVLWAVHADGKRAAVELIREEYQVFGARFSPDGRFLAYASDESGRNEIYVQAFDASGGPLKGEKWQVTKDGGLGLVQWRKDGKELYYLAADGNMMAVAVTTTPTFSAGSSSRLFAAPATFELEGVFERTGTNAVECSCAVAGCEQGNVSRDGQRFVFAVPIVPERAQVSLPRETLAQYTGTYAETQRLLLDWVVTLEGDQLMIQRTGREKVPLYAESDTRFFMKATNGDFEFTKNERGAVKYLFLYRGGGPTQLIRR